jgi:hypothetical protein
MTSVSIRKLVTPFCLFSVVLKLPDRFVCNSSQPAAAVERQMLALLRRFCKVRSICTTNGDHILDSTATSDNTGSVRSGPLFSLPALPMGEIDRTSGVSKAFEHAA